MAKRFRLLRTLLVRLKRRLGYGPRQPRARRGATGQAIDAFASSLTHVPPGDPSDADYLALLALKDGRYRHPVFVDHVGYAPPPNDVVFVGVCNDKYAPGLEALVLSLLRLYPAMQCRFVVYHDGELSSFNQERLLGLYPRFDFQQRETSRYQVSFGDHGNHKRVGLLGYLSLEALEIEGASHVVILDTDLLVLGDISPLWTGERPKAVPNIGAKPIGVVAASFGKVIINSGVLAFPASTLGPAAVRRRDEVLARLSEVTDIDIERFADQRFWNVFLADQDIELLPQNFNCVKTLVCDYFPEEMGRISVLHLTGPKPWFSFINEKLVAPEERVKARKAGQRWPVAFGLWEDAYTRNLLASRLGSFRRDMTPTFERLRNSLAGRPVALIGNGPSINKTDLGAFDQFEKVVFNWFVNHEGWDSFKPDHLVVASHMLFGGWHTANPELPAKYLEALLKHRHRPRLWFPYYFKAYIEKLAELESFEIGYLFFEKPFKQPVAKRGNVEMDITRPLVDSNTGVITAGMPLAVLLGARDIVLAGCDSNYTSTQGSYFYPSAQHASATTREESLTNTWVAGGEGLYGYSVALEALRNLDVRLHDATIDGSLHMLPKISLKDARALALR